MIFLNYFLNNLNKYYEYLDNNIITKLGKSNKIDLPHLHLYGYEGSMKNYYVYYIINKLYNISLKKEEFKLEKNTLKINNNNIDFNIYITKYFRELNLNDKSNYDKLIITKYLKNIVETKNYINDKHIIILKDFDKLTHNCYMTLRRLMEIYSGNVMFICVSTNLSKIPESIKSRCLNIRCPIIEKNKFNIFIKKILNDYYTENNEYLSNMLNNMNIQDDTNLSCITNILDNKEINKLIKNCNNDIYKILLNLELILNNKVIKYTDYLNDTIKKHLDFLKKEKDIYKVMNKNRDFIFTIIYFEKNNKIILEKILKIILKKYNKLLPLLDIIKITAETDHNIIKSSRELYHYEKYFLDIYKMFHNI